MAAILCKTLGELIGNCCECMKLPCSYVGQACAKSCDLLADVMCTPFAPYLIVTLGLNTPSVVYAIKAIVSGSGWSCSPSLARWLVIGGAFGLCHMVAAFYITNIIRAPALPPRLLANATTGLEEGSYQQQQQPPPTSSSSSNNNNNFAPLRSSEQELPGGANSFQRIKHVICYDKGMAVYIMIFLIWIVWLGTGVVQRLSSNDVCDELTSHMTTTILCGYVWMGLVGAAFCCSLLCLR